MAVGFKFKVSEISDEYDGEKLISCIDNNNTGFYITANGVYIVQNNIILTQMLIAEDTVYDVEFVAWPQNGTGSDAQKNAHFVYIYIDGIISGGYRIANSSSIFQNTPSNISLGVSTATLDLYRVWGFRRALNDNESLDCYILDQDDNIDLLFEKRDNNNILNTQGGVTPDSLPDGTRIMIITGKATPTGGTEIASVLAAAQENNKSKYFPCTEISTYIKGATDRSKNFIAHNNGSDIVEGQDMSLKLRLQGTSSLAYPVKNYRIYTKKSTMYVGNNPESVFGETGELVSGGKFAMHDTSAPVAVWCLKADYAESSSSHNTGMACMVNDTLKHTNIKTPAQRDVNTTQYPYEVRTTVDGEPCILFYRETLSDAPIFLGKFNFNNDKSTEAVYGFTGIKGYHNVAPLNNEDNNETEFVAQQYKTETGTSLGVDLTECWEFRNNEDPMGSFLDDDFVSTIVDPDSGDTIPKWTGTFEARYPDEDDLNDQFASGNIIPHYLSTLVSWVKSTGVLSTDTEEQAAAKLTRFRNELSLYFDVEHLCSYFVFTQMMACLDQMVKNMMMAFWYDKNADSSSPMGKVRAYMIFYDNDTILGVINNGRLLAPYNVTRQTIQMYDAQQNPVYFYAGHESVLWNNLATQFPTEIRNAYVKLRGYLTNTRIFQYFDVQQTDKFCERIYNLDALNKYVAPTGMSESAVSPYRDLMQGNRKSHRHFFVNKRMSIFDNEWRAGEYYSSANEISYKGISAANSSIGFTLKQAGNVEVQSDVSDDFVKNYPTPANTDTVITKLTPSAVGTIFHIYGMRQLTKLNVAAWDFDQLNLGNFPYLEEFTFGNKKRNPPQNWKSCGGYIECTGTQYINTGISFLHGYKAELALKVADVSGRKCIFGNYNGNNGATLTIYGTAWYVEAGKVQYAGGVSAGTRYDVVASNITNAYLKVNDEVLIDNPYSGAVYNSLPYYLMAQNDNGSGATYFKGQLYYVKLYDENDVLRFDAYPALDENGVACMYDYVTNQYFYNQGTGDFTVSDEVIEAGSTENHFTKPYYNSGLILGNSMPRLKKFVAQNLTALPSADLSGCPMIEEIDLTNSTQLTSVTLPEGINLKKYFISDANYYNLTLKGITFSIDASYDAAVADVLMNPLTDTLTNLSLLNFKFDENTKLLIAKKPGVWNRGFAGRDGSNNLETQVYISNNYSWFDIKYYADIRNHRIGGDGYFEGVNYFELGDFYIKNLSTGSIMGSRSYVEMNAADVVFDNGLFCQVAVIQNGIMIHNYKVVDGVQIDEVNPYPVKIPDFSKIGSYTFKDCNFDGLDLLKTLVTTPNTQLSTVNVTLPSAQSGSIQTLIDIVSRWNNQLGENSNLKVYGSYTVTDESLTTAQCAAIGYDPSGAATQMSTRIYGLMVTIDQSTIVEIILQTYDPNGEGYNPAVCITFEQNGLGSYVDPNDKTKGWYMTKRQAANASVPNFSGYSQASIGGYQVNDINNICNNNNGLYYLESFNELKYFTNFTGGNNCVFDNNMYLKSVEFPQSISMIGYSCFYKCILLEYIIIYATTPPNFGSNALLQTNSLSHIYVPSESVDAYKSASGWSSYASIIEAIPSN